MQEALYPSSLLRSCRKRHRRRRGGAKNTKKFPPPHVCP
jgi:hypothetical protein